MDTQSVLFASPWHVEITSTDMNEEKASPKTALIRTETSVVSAGTELAILSGNESSWAPLPYVPGYGSVGIIIDKDEGLESFDVGDRIFTHGRHAALSRSNVIMAKVPADLRPEQAVFARIAQIAMVALRVSEAQMGDYVTVLGLGLVGNLAAQLFSIAGCEVIGVDLSEQRRKTAQTTGAAYTIDGKGDVKKAIREITRGNMCRTVVEATGSPRVAYSAGEYAASLGEVVVLGSPRGVFEADVTPLLNRTHLCGNGCITIKGAHEWRLPIEPDGSGNIRHSGRSNVETIFRLMQKGKLKTDPLVTHQVSPREAPAIYKGLKENPDGFLGVVFDWRK